MADKVCGLTIVYAVLAALLKRRRDGKGEHIEVPMVDTMTSFMLVEHGADAIAAGTAGTPGYKRILTPHRRPQRTSDGWIHILPYTSEHYEAIFEVGGREDLRGDSRFADLRACIVNSDFLYQAVQSVTPDFTTQQWLAICDRHRIPATPVVTVDELVAALPVVEHPVAGSYRLIPPPVRFSGSGSPLRRPAPVVGEHTREVLAEVGYPEPEIDRLAAPRSREHEPAEFAPAATTKES
jgi:crotonobetainyl-CoA:carnitine CoA-transferase CaiB-like acyl-CoA transferase